MIIIAGRPASEFLCLHKLPRKNKKTKKRKGTIKKKKEREEKRERKGSSQISAMDNQTSIV